MRDPACLHKSHFSQFRGMCIAEDLAVWWHGPGIRLGASAGLQVCKVGGGAADLRIIIELDAYAPFNLSNWGGNQLVSAVEVLV